MDTGVAAVNSEELLDIAGDLFSFHDYEIQNNVEESVENEVVKIVTVPATGTTIPCQQNFDGAYNFNMSLDHLHQQKTWLYSNLLGQIFINMNNVLIVNFKTDETYNQKLFLRAMLVYVSSDHVSSPVVRCTVHSVEDDPDMQCHDRIDDTCYCSNFNNVGHVLKSESDSAIYCYDKTSKRHSVLVPVIKPHAGTDYFSSAYTFSCKSSCTRGMQRRAVQIIFTLEDSNCSVLGRKSLPVKICSCPKRDKDRQERDHGLAKGGTKRSLTTKTLPTQKLIKLEHDSVQELKKKIQDELNNVIFPSLRKIQNYLSML